MLGRETVAPCYRQLALCELPKTPLFPIFPALPKLCLREALPIE